MEKVFVPEDFYCPITGEIMKNPVSDPEGNTYEYDSIMRWLSTKSISPMTRSPLIESDLVKNHGMRKSIESIMSKLSEDQLCIRSRIVQEEMKPFTEPLQDIQLKTSVKEDSVYISIQTPTITTRAPVDLVLCIDVSGSMGSEATLKGDDGGSVRHGISILSLTVSSAKTILNSLSDNDNLSIVTYTDTAKCIVENMACTQESKLLIEQQLDMLRPLNTTNLWDGIHTSLEIIKKNTPPERVRGIFVLTDGVPNVEPPRGHEYMLEKYFRQNEMNCMINCYGFGYSLKSDLLDSISHISGGDGYSFIPDASLLGNVFIHGITNFLISIQNARLKIELLNGNQFKDGSTTQLMGVLSTLKYGKQKNLIFDLKSGHSVVNKDDINVSLMLPNKDIESEFVETDEVYISEQSLRRKMIESLESWIQMKKYNTSGLEDEVSGLIRDIRLIPPTTYVHNILTDLEGQIREALNMTEQGRREDWFSRWGIHYLRSLRSAYLNEICNNFKDKGVSNFGGELFDTIRDEISDIFDSIPPPKRVCVDCRGGAVSRSQVSAPPPDMRQYNNPGGGCCAKGSLILMADHTYKKVEDLWKGDKVVSFKNDIDGVHCINYTTSEIECVIETKCEKGKEQMVKIDNLQITPYHPIMDDTYTWTFPKFMGEVKEVSCESMYTFIVKDRGSVIIDNHIFATYGHNLEGDVISHNYFGTEKVVQDLKMFETYDYGHINLIKTDIKRGRDGLINKIIHIEDKFFQAFL